MNIMHQSNPITKQLPVDGERNAVVRQTKQKHNNKGSKTLRTCP